MLFNYKKGFSKNILNFIEKTNRKYLEKLEFSILFDNSVKKVTGSNPAYIFLDSNIFLRLFKWTICAVIIVNVDLFLL